MKIVIPETDGIIAEHFGHCEHFLLFEIIQGNIVGTESIENPGHRPGFLPNFLHERGIEVVLAGGIGGGALDLFRAHGMEVITGIQGDCRKAAEQFAAGKLVSTATVCHQHHQEGHCDH